MVFNVFHGFKGVFELVDGSGGVSQSIGALVSLLEENVKALAQDAPLPATRRL